MLREVTSQPPKYILGMSNMVFSILWDGKADLGGIRDLQAFTEQHYDVERVLLVDGVNGEWVSEDDPRLQQGPPFIAVFKRRD